MNQRIQAYRQGQEGEERVVEIMRQNLDGNWVLLRNVTLPGRNKGDIDAVLVGPPGVWALEIKNWSGAYHNWGEHWEITAGKRPKPVRSSPSRQAKKNAARLANFFRADGLRQWVEPAVIWVNRESRLAIEQPSVPVWTPERLPDELGNLWQGRTLDESARARVIEKLTALCERRSREHKA
jgi:hypothetical protein